MEARGQIGEGREAKKEQYTVTRMRTMTCQNNMVNKLEREKKQRRKYDVQHFKEIL